ncbi:hypothetical protein JYU29_04965 [Tianweitania sp. BSSL-BM11]|uniref:Uncharacterized protein n=1 Tax=Tianweitania aestuarii TaxID=2814886 RepID=A0ABS5RSK4_9HYPH|nr:hypothetical protein [Tianweitania aestuarii]MBS9720038.1 hypothetical protein [Tianweitania aestuarii]
MVAKPTTPFRSGNAGEISSDAKNRVDIKQYYSGGLAYKNIEPVPQSGFRQMGGSWRKGQIAATVAPRFVSLNLDNGTTLACFVMEGQVAIYTESGLAYVVPIARLTPDLIPNLEFYAEGRTIGIFHAYMRPLRLFLDPASNSWLVSDWTFAPPPKVDLGGNYPRSADMWEIFIRWADRDNTVALSVTVNGETTPSVRLTDSAGNLVSVAADNADWNKFAADVAAAIQALPNIGPTVTGFQSTELGDSRRLIITFGGDLLGEEYDLAAVVTNTSEVSALPVHTSIGRTELEYLFSDARHWPGLAVLVQDRMAYADIAAEGGALALSAVAEYFDLDTAGKSDSAARLDRIRSQTSERINQVKESRYILLFTDRGVYFVTNRTIERNTPLNFVLASEVGGQPHCQAFDLEGVIYYVAINQRGTSEAYAGGNQLLSLVYDDVSTSYNADTVSLLASHLTQGIIRTARQKPLTDFDASKGWLLRADGRLVAAQMIKNQDILGFCEWIAASGGVVREIGIDGRNRLWVAVQRNGVIGIELYDPSIYLHDAMVATPNLAGVISGLPYENGAVLYAVADGFEIGPFTCQNGTIDLRDAYASAIVGRWQRPYFESMPYRAVTPGDEVIERPGRIHTANVSLVDTTSIAIGANGQPPEEQPLLTVDDPADRPMPGKSKTITVTGLLGYVDGTTLVITQNKPGRFRVSQFSVGTKL